MKSHSEFSESTGTINPFDTNKFHANPFEAVQHHLETPELLAFSQASKTAKILTHAEVKSRMTKKLVSAVLLGNQERVKEIIDKDPMLLLNNTAKVEDYSGRMIQKKTAFQAALINSDVEMAEMIKPYLVALENGQDKLESQFDEVFPEGIDAQVAMQQSQAFDFGEIAQAIINAPQDAIKQALAKNFDENKYELHMKLNSFRVLFDEISENEEIFNPYHLVHAYQFFEDHYRNFKDVDQRDLFWRQVVGYTQRKLPAYFFQAFAQGLFQILYKGEDFNRSFEFRHVELSDAIVSVNAPESACGLGLDVAAELDGTLTPLAWAMPEPVSYSVCLGMFLSSKNIKLGELICPPSPGSVIRNILM